jgi:hypothetical protein
MHLIPKKKMEAQSACETTFQIVTTATLDNPYTAMFL